MRFDRVFASPAARALETCELAGCGASAEPEADLAEWDYGDYEGRRSVDIHCERPGWNVYADGCPGGETTQQVAARADRLITRLSSLSGTIGLFSHGQFGCSLACRWIGQPVGFAAHLLFGTGSIGILGMRPELADLRVLAHWNIRPTGYAHIAAGDPPIETRPQDAA